MQRFSLLLAVALVAACASPTRIDERYRDPDFDGAFDKILVLTLMGQDVYREEAEDAVVRKIEAAGVEAVSRRALFGGRTPTREQVEAKVAEHGIDGVLVLQLGALGASDAGRRSLADVRGGLGDYDDVIGYVLTGTAGVGRGDSLSANVLVNLYDVDSRKRIWHITTITDNPGSPMGLIADVADEVGRQLRREKFL